MSSNTNSSSILEERVSDFELDRFLGFPVSTSVSWFKIQSPVLLTNQVVKFD
jgi:hypothetical protein